MKKFQNILLPLISCTFLIFAAGCPGEDGNTDGGTAVDAGGDGDGDGDPGTCAAYCTAVVANCAGTYESEAACLDYCTAASGWAPGTDTDTTGNTVGCRQNFAESSTCANAHPAGNNVCGSWCDVYCDTFDNNCGNTDSAFANDGACMTACAEFPSNGAQTDIEFDSVQCRIYHGGAPAAADPALHCGHAQPIATGFCVGDADQFVFRADAPSAYTQVERVGMPAVSTALIPAANKDAYNAGSPADDAAGTFVPDIVASIDGLHDALDDDLTGLGLVPCTTPGDGTGTCVAQGAPLVVPDVIKIDSSAAAGFPNGRRLQDPVMDVTLAVILIDFAVAGQGATSLVGALNPTANDVGVEGAFLTTFPYLHPAQQP